ncbi:ninein-like protein isoform X1 [Labrus mixtus]|uniref:ninein-like protein isoform X1 n=1 Tax=Labrus mixtus TaxID=508554 RepID=UPI0029C026FD|nr:ninein-like protein isoform X1 [Labrus mixtus]XP_060896447.1 ninein-like protein isoform X1 [Labrus mixtus]
MEEAEHSHYVDQLRSEFNSCDTTATGFLDREELTVLCRKLQLDAHLPLLLDTLLGARTYARVNFEEFKEGFVAVLSRSLDFSTSEDDSSYLEPVVPEEVKPKFVKGTKRYGRRSRPDNKPDSALTCDSEDSPLSRNEATDSSPTGVRRAKLRRSTSLESVESLKSDEDVGSQKENIQPDFQSKGPQQKEVDLGSVVEGGGRGVCGGGVLTAMCGHPGLQQLNTEDLDLLLRKLDPDLDGRVSIRDFQKVLRGSAPISCSTPVRPADLQRAPQRSEAVSEEHCARSTTPSLLTATVGHRVLSRLDDGSGCSTPERVTALWTEEGIRNSWDILQTLDFPLEERLSLADLTLALDNELLVSGNGIHQAALISYKNEIQHLQMVAEQACKERDKVKTDLDLADQRNLQLVREVDDRHASMETLNQTRIRDLEQEYRDRLAALRTQSEQENEALLQQVERERSTLQVELQLIRAQEAELQEELCSATQENCRLEEELSAVKLKLTDTESSVNRLQRDLDQLLHDKFGSLDPSGAGLSNEERFSEIVKEYELRCRELRDRNDELSSEVELLKSQKSVRKSRRSAGDDISALSWSEQHHTDSAESDSDESDMKRSSSPLVRKKLQPADKTALGSLDNISGLAVSIQTELALEQLKQKHNQELQQLHIKLETQVNYYERSLEVMRQSMEVERKDISQAFKMEISEVEEQKAQAELQVKQLRETLDKLQTQIQHGGGGGWSNEQERRMHRERAELEQNFAKEIGNLVQRLSAEKDQLEAELKLKMDQEVMLVREEAEQQLSQVKLQHTEGQCCLIHQLHQERQQLQEQKGFWENRLAESEQERQRCQERAGEEQAWIYSQFSSEKKRMEEQHEEKVHQLQSSCLQMSQLEASLEEFRERCGQLEEDLAASCGRCSELEARLEEACTQLAESITFLESHEVLKKRFASEKSFLEEELQLVKSREEQLLLQVTQQKEELGNLKAMSYSIQQDREQVADNCSRLSNAFNQQQAQLRAKEQTVHSLRSELENLQEAMRNKVECLSRLTAELDSLKTDRARLIQDLKDQAMAVDNLQLELDGVSEELDRKKSSEEALQEALKVEQTRTLQIRSSLDEEREEACRLSQENVGYTRLADQLSTQIVEMEEEISVLRDHLRELSSQLNETADLVLDLKRQLNSKTRVMNQLQAEAANGTELLQIAKASSEKDHSNIQQLTNQLEVKDEELNQVRLQVLRLQEVLQDYQNQLREAEEDFEQEKSRLKQQLMELERLVLALEEVMDPGSPHRAQLEEVRSENGALQERLSFLQQEVQSLEDDVAKKRRKLEEMEREHESSREEEEKLHKENSRYREEVLDLSSRNLQLSNDNAELSARLRGDQESVQMLQEHLAMVSKAQEEEGASVRRLQDAAIQQEREKLLQQTSWMQERQLLERELHSCKEKLGRLSELEAELSGVTSKLQRLEEDKAKLLRDADDRNNKVEKLQQSLLSVEPEVELLRSQLHAVNQVNLGHAQEVPDLQRKLQDGQSKIGELESSVKKLMREKEELRQALEEQDEQTSISFQEETHKLRVQNQELQLKLSELQVQGLEVHKLTQEQQILKTKLKELETAQTQAEDQALQADTALSLVQAQHLRQLQELQERAGEGTREQVELLQARLVEEQRRSQQLEDTLRLQAQQSGTQLSMKQDQYEKAMAALQQRMEELETKLKGVRLVLQEKVQQLKEQMAKNTKSSMLLKDLYVENSQLMKALQVTEQRQKSAEKNNFLLEEKVHALNKLLREIVPASLAT